MDSRNLKIYNDVTAKLLQEFAKDRDKNVVFSPLSVLIILGMLMDATEGETRAEILRAICGSESAEDATEKDFPELNSKEWIQWISEIGRDLAKSGALMSSNAVCVNETMNGKILSEYEKRLQDHFDGKLFVTKNLAKAVNEWVNKATKGMIQEIVDESINSSLVCLLNAIAFDAKWLRKVKQDDIEFGEFTNADKSVSEVTMINSLELQYIEDTYFTGFIKPYKDVGFSYMALLPKMKNSKFFYNAINNIDFTTLYQSKYSEKVIVEIPEHKLDFGKQLNEFFESLGMNRIFSDHAEFGPMTTEWIKVDSILHKAHMEVDRNGTKAAAVTAVMFAAGCAPQPKEKEVILDRPFVFAIVHNDTGLPVFAGVVNHIKEGEYDAERFEPEECIFETEEEAEAYLKDMYHRIADRVHPDKNPLYEKSEEIRQLFAEAQEAYKLKDPFWLQMIEYNLKRTLSELEQE